MSIEFRLKYLRDTIDKNVNDILLKWNARKVLLNESFDEDHKEFCPVCMNAGKECVLKYCYVNLDEAIYKCESSACLYPFRNFKYKNFADRTIFRYERILETSENRTDQKIFTSPAKVEAGDAIDEFNISWLGDTYNDNYTDELDSIISAPVEGQTCDIKDIINNLCVDQATTTLATFKSPARSGSGCSPKSTSAPKLSKCLEYIEHISPTKQTNFNHIKSKTSVGHSFTSVKLSASVPVLKRGFKKIRSTKNREIRPVQSIVQQQPLGFLEWLNVVSKTEPKQIQELEFASVSECKASGDLNTNNSGLAASNTTSSEPSTGQPILMTPESPQSDQLPNITRPCLLYKLDHSEFEPINGQSEATPSDHCDQPVTTRSLQDLLPPDEDINPPDEDVNMSSTESNVEHLGFVSGESVSAAFKIINTENVISINLCGQDHTATNSMQTESTRSTLPANSNITKIEKQKLKLERQEKLRLEREKLKAERKKKRKLEQKEKRRLKAANAPPKQTNQQTKVNFKQKNFNIEAEEHFLGFETVEAFTAVTLREKELVWLQLK